MAKKSSFLNNHVIITGGASGIGAALGELFAQGGARVVLLDLNQEKLEQTAGRLAQETGSRVYSAVADVSDFEGFKKAVGRAVSDLGPVDVFINNAGIGVSGEFIYNTVEEINAITSVNYLGMVYGSKIALEHFHAQGFGHLVNVASVAGLQGFPKMSLYCGTKAGIVAFSQALRFEMKRAGLCISLALPSTTDTPMIMDKMGAEEGEEDHAPGILMAIPMCSTQKVAQAIFQGISKKKFFIFPTLTDRGTLWARSFAQAPFNLFIRSVGFKGFEKKRERLMAEYQKQQAC